MSFFKVVQPQPEAMQHAVTRRSGFDYLAACRVTGSVLPGRGLSTMSRVISDAVDDQSVAAAPRSKDTRGVPHLAHRMPEEASPSRCVEDFSGSLTEPRKRESSFMAGSHDLLNPKAIFLVLGIGGKSLSHPQARA